MALRSIITVPHPTLRAHAAPVEKIDDEVRRTLMDMADTMYDAPGIGLAANQINLPRRLVVIDTKWREGDTKREPLLMVNPAIIWQSEERSTWQEGCLSIPQQFAEVERPLQVRVTYQDINGKTEEILGEGLLSHCLQHEIDHLNGVLFIDYLSTLKRNIILRKVKKLTKDDDTAVL
jgi:peptide deformylase